MVKHRVAITVGMNIGVERDRSTLVVMGENIAAAH